MNIEELSIFLLAPVSQIALIVGIAEIIKKLGMNKKFIPLFDLLLGLISGVGIYGVYLKYGVPVGIVIGIALGLSACGLFSGIKNVITTENKKEKNND